MRRSMSIGRSRGQGEGISSEALIDALHAKLAAHFIDLRSARAGAPLFLLEHGLGAASLGDLLGGVRVALGEYPVDGGWWNIRPLPLLISATDVGYSYEGTGTDYWPIFAARFGLARGFDRAVLSRLFEQAAHQYNLARPPETAWNLAFCHIAWPVLHAILPAELLQPLTRCLREVRGRLDVLATDADLLAPVRSRAALQSGLRLSAWLENEPIAAAIVRAFLDPSAPPGIEPSAMARITRDLARDHLASASLRDARRRQKSLAEATDRRSSRRRVAASEIRIAPLILRRAERAWSLALKMPQMDEADRVAAREALDAGRWRAALWGKGPPIPSRNLFSDYPIPLALETLPPADTPILADLDYPSLAPEARQFLESLRIHTGPYLLFSDADAAGDYCQMQTASLSANSRYMLLVSPEHLPAPASALIEGQIAGYHIISVDAGANDMAPWLTALQLTVSAPAQFRWVGTAEQEQHRPRRRFAPGSSLAFELVTGGGDCEVSLTAPDGSASRIRGASPLIGGFTPTKAGAYALRYGEGACTEFDVAEIAEHAPLVTIDADAGTGAITDLATRGITLRFDSVASLQEAEFELALVIGGRTIARACDILPDTPCRLGPNHMIWERLLTAEAAEYLLEAQSAELVVRVKQLAEARFAFEAVQAPFAWRRAADGALIAEDEVGELALFTSEAATPLAIEGHGPALPTEDVLLVRAGRDGPLAAGGYCLGPKIWRANDAPAPKRPERLLRRFDGGTETASGGAADARTVVEALIAWSAARVDHPVTQYRRGQTIRDLEQWMVAQLCGDAWASVEADLSGQQGGRFAEEFLDACQTLKVGFAHVPLSRAQENLLHRTLLRMIKARNIRLTPSSALEAISDEFAAELDGLFNDAYAALFEAIEAVGDRPPFHPDDDIDVGEASDDWDRALCLAADRSALGDLLELLRPLEAGDALSRADFATMTPDETIDFLFGWMAMKDVRPLAHARAWSHDLVEASFWLFAKPGVAARLPWRSATQRLLADRFAARAIRYAVLRSGATEGGAE